MTGNPMMLLALGLLLVGFAFKISAVPFHMWTPDAYEGAPAIVTGFMSTGVKAAAFAAFARVFLSALRAVQGRVGAGRAPLIAIATMVLGTVVGVAQSNLKRMLAYSSIAHGGYLLVGLVAANQVGKAAILFYLLAYSVTNLAAFGVIALLGSRDKRQRQPSRLRGSVAHAPRARRVDDRVPALARRPAADGRLHRQVVHLQCRRQRRLLQSCRSSACSPASISVFFYLRVVVMMYMAEREGEAVQVRVTGVGMAALAVSIAAIFYLGVLPTKVLDLAASSISTIF